MEGEVGQAIDQVSVSRLNSFISCLEGWYSEGGEDTWPAGEDTWPGSTARALGVGRLSAHNGKAQVAVSILEYDFLIWAMYLVHCGITASAAETPAFQWYLDATCSPKGTF